MTDMHDQESEFIRLLRQTPFDDLPSEEHRNQLRGQVLARFEFAGQGKSARGWLQRAFQQGRETMRRPIPRFVAAAAVCLALVAVWTLVPGQQSTAQAFNAFAEAIASAKSATFQMEVKVEGQGKQKLQGFYLAPGKMRNEMKGIVTVMDLKAGKFLTLIPQQKMATVMIAKNMPAEPDKPIFNDFFERMRDLLSKSRDAKEDEFKRLGEKEIDGRPVIGFRFDSPLQMLTLWGDPATGLPVLVETVWSGIPHTEATMSHFELNADLKPELFDTTPPADYKVHVLDIDVSPPTEATLIEALRLATDMNDGIFIDNLDTASTQTLIIKRALSGKDESKDSTPELMKLAIAMGRGMMFPLELPESADARYAGKGVKLNEPDRPIFWYKPKGAKQYRVIYADLSVKDAEQAPEVAGAVKIEKTSQSPPPGKK